MAVGAEKLHAYQGVAGRLHHVREATRERWTTWREAHSLRSLDPRTWPVFGGRPDSAPPTPDDAHDYSHIYRRKSRMELVRVSAAVTGIEFSYAAETAFVSPTLLQMRVDHQVMTLAWALSPLVGFFVTPVLGSLSDRCRLSFGRRRPFIALLGIGVLLGLLLVPNGESLGYLFGDRRPNAPKPPVSPSPSPPPPPPPPPPPLPPLSPPVVSVKPKANATRPALPAMRPTSIVPPGDGAGGGDAQTNPSNSGGGSAHPWGVFFTVAGTVLLDFDADACQSPARAYLLDVCVPEDHARGLSTFTIMAGLGGCMGYALGAVDWDSTAIGQALGGHVRAVFTLVTFIFAGCVIATITSFRELPLSLLERQAEAASSAQVSVSTRDQYKQLAGENGAVVGLEEPKPIPVSQGYQNPEAVIQETSFNEPVPQPIVPGLEEGPASPTLKQYLLSILYMPASMRILCLTNLFCWMAHVCYSLYFTDYVGEAVFGGDPKADEGTLSRQLYEDGVRFGCWGMSMYSLSCACYSFVIERLIKRFGAKRVYVGGLLVYGCGMSLMAICCHRVAVIIFSWTAGVMYSTLFTMPYLLVAHYHALDTFAETAEGSPQVGGQLRGLGTDVAIVSSMVFLAQLLLSCGMGSVVSAAGSTTAVVASAAVLALCGAGAASRVMYLDL